MSYRWKPSRAKAREFAQKMADIDAYCIENGIQQSASSDSYYFSVRGVDYRVSNHSVEASYIHSGGRHHSHGREAGTVYIHASKTRIIEIYENLMAGKQLDGFGNVKEA